jgi:acetyltransferase-like isoleucine patch superfamily enzyme
MPPQPEKEKWLPTIIEDGASLGSNCTILPVTVGKDAVVGAGATVTKDVPAGAIVAGCPAKILRYKEGYGPEA